MKPSRKISLEFTSTLSRPGWEFSRRHPRSLSNGNSEVTTWIHDACWKCYGFCLELHDNSSRNASCGGWANHLNIMWQMILSCSIFWGRSSKEMIETRMPWYPDGIAKLYHVSYRIRCSSTCAEHKGLGGEPNKIVQFKRVNQVEQMWNPWGIHVSSVSFQTAATAWGLEA